MEADWEVEIGGGANGAAAPIIDALWNGFVDLRRYPERIVEIAEAVAFPPLARLLLALNRAESPLWTSKCDLWEPDELTSRGISAGDSGAASAMACYVDLLPVEGKVFAPWETAEAFCRELVSRLAELEVPECRAEFVVREAIAGNAEGFGVTAYLSGAGPLRSTAAEALEAALLAFAGSIPSPAPPEAAVPKQQWKRAPGATEVLP